MTDPVQTPQADPASTPTIEPTQTAGSPTPAAPADGKSPLDILDQILKDAQTKADGAAADKSAEDLKVLEAERERQRLEDEQNLKEELGKIEGMKDSPQYQAMQQQKEEQKEENTQRAQAMDGMEIVQLEHKKL
jgi:hypothetical protein